MALPRHSQVSRIIRSRLLRGAYSGRLPSERDLASELGTNPKTVQCALAQLEAVGLVRREQRKGTFAVPLIGGSPESRTMRVRLVHSIGNLQESNALSFWSSRVIFQFQRAAATLGLEVILEYADLLETDRVVMDAVIHSRDLRCAGTCLLSSPIDTPLALRLSEAVGPVVVADWDLEEPLFPHVVFDNLNAGCLAAQHLLELGHRRLAWLDYDLPETSRKDRRRGVEETLRQAGTTLSAEVFPGGMDDFTRSLLEVLRGPGRPTALVCGNPDLADIAIYVANRNGFPVPEQLSVIALGQAGETPAPPGLAVIGMDYEGMGAKSLELLLDERASAHPRREVARVWLESGITTAVAPQNESS